MRTLGPIAAIALLAMFGLASCGNDDDDGASAELVAFCDGAVQGEALFAVLEQDPTDEDTVAEMNGHLDAIEQNAPDDIGEESTVVVTAVRSAMTGDMSGIESEEFFAAESSWDIYVSDNCPTDASVALTAVDYAYNGVPETLDAGRVSFAMTNEGDEAHEMALIAIAEGEERSIIEIFEAQDEAAATFVTNAATNPSGDAAMTVDVEAGRYALICLIPTGTPSLDEVDFEAEAPPHAAEGMYAEFEVE